ncbi:MAG: hypothetical protein IJ868_05225 [Prevotella sp.]|nr:hypothetical protein [Prevotella sp.]
MDKVRNHEQGKWKPIDFHRPQPDDNWPYRNKPRQGDDRQYGVKSPKFERHIFIRRDQVFFDIDAQLGMIADGRRTPDGAEDDTITNATTKYQQMFYRWIDRHIGEAKTTMSAMVLEKFRETAMNSIKDVDEVDITLLVPEWYDDTTFPQLCDKVHEYVVAATMADFCMMRLTSKDPVTLDKVSQYTEAIMEIRKLINMAKPGRISKPLKPF